MKFVVFMHGKDYPHETCEKHEFQYWFEVLGFLASLKGDVERGKVVEISSEEGDVET